MQEAIDLYRQSFTAASPDLTIFFAELAAVPATAEFSAIIGKAALYPMSHKLDVVIHVATQMESPATLARALKQMSEGFILTPIHHLGTTIHPTRERMRMIVPVMYLDSYWSTDICFTNYAAEAGVTDRIVRRKFRAMFAGKDIEPRFADPRALAEHFLHRN
ncbi:MAG: hypothetical protein HZC01_00610 [Candidatus Kerfeldbacteria bacterium]|nr:hypothetical protein [Candidatus Kerfeldbacteria bacterium]